MKWIATPQRNTWTKRILFDEQTTYGSMQTMYVRVHVDVGFLSRSPRLRRNNRQFFSFQRDHSRVFSSIGVLLQPEGKEEGKRGDSSL